MKQAEFRGCDNFVCARVIKDDKTGFETGPVTVVAPIASVAKTSEVSSETHYYDNTGLIQIRAVGVDTVTFVVPAMYLDKLAMVTGAYIDPQTGAYMSGEDTDEEFAVGYRLKLTDGSYRYVWRLKGTFSGVPDENSNTESNSVDTQNQQVVFSGTKTIYEFPNVGARRDIVMDERDGLCDFSTFFSIVQTPATIPALAKASTTAISVSPTTAEIAEGNTTTIVATTTPTGNPVTWISSNPAVASVAVAEGAPKNYGTVTGVSAGTAVITAVSGSYSASTTVTVTAGA
jgi:phi13 family phage major tail protein